VKKDATRTDAPKADRAKTKLVYKVDEVSRLTGVDTATLTAWEDEFPFLSAGQTGSGEKFYRQQDVAIIARIKELAESKTLTVAGIKRRVEDEFGLARTTPVHPEKLRRALHDVRDELEEIVAGLGGGRKKKA
jgi:DNA-binding transcriptional MerR regulator